MDLNQRDGVSLWRQIGEDLMEKIDSGKLEPEERLPSSKELAESYGVNRHTVLRAISHLQAEGYLRVQRGRGTYAIVNRLEYRLGARRWFEENLLQSNHVPTRTVISVEDIPAPNQISDALQIDEGAPVVFVKLLGEADDSPINFGYHYFPAERLNGVSKAFRAFNDKPTTELSFKKILNSVGVPDFRRKSIRIRSRVPSPEEAWRLRMPQAEQVLETEVVNVGTNDIPVVYANTCFCSSRVELVMDL